MKVTCAKCKAENTLNPTDERPLTWKCAAILEKGARRGEMCGAANTLEGKPAQT